MIPKKIKDMLFKSADLKRVFYHTKNMEQYSFYVGREDGIEKTLLAMGYMIDQIWDKNIINEKEVNKVKKEIDFSKIPYLEMKVIKVKKEKREKVKCEHSCLIKIQDLPYRVYRCDKCGYYLYPPLKKNYLVIKRKEKANIVNCENLEEMRFPCYCEFDANKGSGGKPGETYKVHGIGRVDKTFTEREEQYTLSWADRQSDREGDKKIANLSVICQTPSLIRLIEIYDIHVRKAKLLIFKEEK